MTSLHNLTVTEEKLIELDYGSSGLLLSMLDVNSRLEK